MKGIFDGAEMIGPAAHRRSDFMYYHFEMCEEICCLTGWGNTYRT